MYLDRLEVQALYEERLREAQTVRRFLGTRRASQLPALLKSLLLIFI
jgi:hypothetical protein